MGDVELGLRVAIALEQFWVIMDPWEGNRRFEALLAAGDDVDPLLRASALRCYSGTSHTTGKYGQAIEAAEESVALCREAGDDVGAATVLHRIAVARLAAGETAGVRSLLHESRALFHGVGSPG